MPGTIRDTRDTILSNNTPSGSLGSSGAVVQSSDNGLQYSNGRIELNSHTGVLHNGFTNEYIEERRNEDRELTELENIRRERSRDELLGALRRERASRPVEQSDNPNVVISQYDTTDAVFELRDQSNEPVQDMSFRTEYDPTVIDSSAVPRGSSRSEGRCVDDYYRVKEDPRRERPYSKNGRIINKGRVFDFKQ